jgi:fructose/tagatose bisphosphate aldolase
MKSNDRERGRVILTPGTHIPEDVEFTEVGRSTRRQFFTPMELLRPVVGMPLALMQANIRHRSQIVPFIEAFVDSEATGLILAISESVQRSFGVCVEDVAYFASRIIEEQNRSRESGRVARKRVAFLFDHALTYEAAKQALQAGVSGIMYDPSMGGRRAVSIEENISLSKRFVELAARYEASVELEVGVIPGMEGAVETEFTDPSALAVLVKVFPEVAVAVSVGNEHYKLSPKGRGLQLGLFSRIREAVPGIPLVLHGGTGVSDADLRSAIASCLLDKLNVGTEFMKQTLQALAGAMEMEKPTSQQLRDPVYYRSLLFHLDTYPQKYLGVAQKAVYRAASAKLAFLAGGL